MQNDNFYSSLLDNVPHGLIQVGEDNHLQNMANFSTLVSAKMSAMPKTTVGDKGKHDEATQQQKFSDWTGTNGDTKAMAKDLMNRGLVGADQIYYDQPDTSTKNGIINSQGDWKVAAIQQILANARRLNIRTPESVMANKDVLIGNPRFRDAINNPVFQSIHPNWWQIITNSILPERWAIVDKQNKDTAKK